MKISPARRIAYDVLQRVETQSAFASDVLYASLRDAPARLLPAATRARDAALATELVFGVLRWQRLLDFLIAQNIRIPLSEFDPEVLLALRLGLYQIRFLSRIPASAAINESVELVKRARKASAASLVNAVLRRLDRDPHADIAPLVPPEASPAERFAIELSHPTWLVERWLLRFGEARTRALLEANNRPPRLTCAVFHGDVEVVSTSLTAAGAMVRPARWLRSALEISGADPSATRAYAVGWTSIQDEASQMIAHLLGVQPGHSVLDLCAAPGGKLALLAHAAGTGARVIAVDLYPHRLRVVREQLTRLGISGVEMLAHDATVPLPFDTPFDRVLLDTTCSGTGTLARNPEIRWRLRAEDLIALANTQSQMLANAFAGVAPGGRLVYSTCSLEPEENEEVVSRALAAHPEFQLVNASDSLARHLLPGVTSNSLFDSEGYFRTFSPQHATDGFFAAVIQRD